MEAIFNDKYKKLIKNINMDKFVNIFTNSVNKLSPIKNHNYKRNVKYTLNDYIFGIIDVLKNFISWNSYNGLIKGDTLRKKHIEFNKLGVYEDIYTTLLTKQLKKNKCKQLKYQSMDSSNIRDLVGNKFSEYNFNCKNQKGYSSKCIKINALVTTNGIPLSIDVNKGNIYDSKLFSKTINNQIIQNDPKKYTKNNRYKQYFLADKGYDTKEIINEANKLGYISIIPQNKRNIRNKKLLRYLNMQRIKILKKRHVVENFFSWIKKFPKIKHLYERKIDSYKGLLFMSLIIILSRRVLNSNH